MRKRIADGNYRRTHVPGGRASACKRPTVAKHAPVWGRCATGVERCHNFFVQCSRVFRRFDRSACSDLAWIEMAACVILLRSGFVS